MYKASCPVKGRPHFVPVHTYLPHHGKFSSSSRQSTMTTHVQRVSWY